MHFWICISLIAAMMVLSGCQGVLADDGSDLMQVELNTFNADSTALHESMQAVQTEVAATVQVVETQLALSYDYNRVLVATARAGEDATPVISLEVNETGPMPISMFDLSDGRMRFVQIGAAGQITPEDRCFVTHQEFFDPTEINVIYLTALGLNVQQGTNVRVDWVYDGSLVHQSQWVAPASVDGQCIAIELRPSNAPFTAGNWTATLFVNGLPLDPAPFTILGM